MDVNFRTTISEINTSLSQLDEKKSLEAGIVVASKVLELLGINDVGSADNVVDGGLLKLPNSERQDPWFHPHPWMRGERAAFELIDSDLLPVEAKFYWLQKRGNAYVAGGVHFTKNWEDHDFTRTDEFKIGIDFFLTQDAESVLVVLSNRGKLRVMELSSKVSNTQLEIFERWFQAKSLQNRDSLHALLWESFKLQAVNAKFYDGVANAFAELLMHLKSHGKDEEEAKLFASRLLGRLIFVWFLRKMGSISATVGYFDPTANSQIDYYRNDVERLFFRTLNTPIGDRVVEGNETLDIETPYLNGGLFAPHPGDWLEDPTLSFPDFFFERLFDHFENFNFTTDESTPEYEQVAIDPEMLGRVFESLLASQVSATGEQARRAKGAFYTPREVVAYMCRESVRNHLFSAEPDDERLRKAVFKLLDTSDQDWAIAGSNSLRDIPQDLRQKISSGLGELRSIDPACGSGAFPLGLLQLLTKLHLRLDPRLDGYKLKLSILQKNIFGIDIEPMAIEISRLRAWLSLIVEEQKNKTLQPLPNLDFNFVCANSLVGLDGNDLFTDEKLQEKLQALRESYFLAVTPDKKKVIQKEYTALLQPDLLDHIDTRASQLKTFNPFDADHVAAFFDSEHMFGLENGFDMVLGNPPYIGEKGHTGLFASVKKANLGKRFYMGKMDYFYFFFHLGLDLVREGGTVSLITTNYFVTATASKKLVSDIQSRSSIIQMVNFGELRLFDSAAGQHNMITSLRKTSNSQSAKIVQVHESVSGKATSDKLDDIFAGNPSVVNVFQVAQENLIQEHLIQIANDSRSPIVSLLNDLSAEGVSLGNHFDVFQGILTSADSVSSAHLRKIPSWTYQAGDGIFVLTKDEVERMSLTDYEMEIVKPWFKSSDIDKFHVNESASTFVIYADKRLRNLENRPMLAAHLEKFKQIVGNSSSNAPYLHRPRSFDMEGPKIVTPFKTPTNRFALVDAPWFASADVYYVLQKTNYLSLEALCGVLNSKLVLAWLALRGKRKGGLLEVYQQPLLAVPLPKSLNGKGEVISKLESVVRRASSSKKSTENRTESDLSREIDSLVVELYGLGDGARHDLEQWQFKP